MSAATGATPDTREADVVIAEAFEAIYGREYPHRPLLLLESEKIDMGRFVLDALANSGLAVVPRALIEALDAALDAAEEHDYTTPAVRVPLGVWQDVAIARDAVREGQG